MTNTRQILIKRLEKLQKHFEAYLKRFASIQDYLGTKVFPLLLEVAGIGVKA